MKNYKNVELGKLDEIIRLENGKVFLHDKLELSGCEVSINTVPGGFKVTFNHRHKQNEEVYIILKCEGILTVDGEPVNLKEGSAVKVLPDAARTIENTADGEFEFICVQAKQNSLEQFGLADAELC